MSEAYFAFKKRPFSTFPRTETFFPAESIENARKTIISVLEREAGVPLIFGKNGTGKSLLLKQIAKHFELDYSVVFIANPGLKTSKAFFQQLLHEIQQPYCNLDENELRLLFRNYLYQFESPHILILIDEAQTLGQKVLEELRILLDSSHENRSKIQIVLAGTGTFEEKLTHPKLAAFQQHVITRCYLEPFNWKETEDYIVWQMQEVGAKSPESIFTPEARKTVHKLTDGLPRLINQLGEESLFLAKSLQRKRIDETMIQEAWGILQQVPIELVVKQEVQSPLPQSCESIEFGELSDDGDFDDTVTPVTSNNSDTIESANCEMEECPVEETVILKIPHFSQSTPSVQVSPCEDFLQKMRVMEATIAQNFSTNNLSGSNQASIFNVPGPRFL